MEEWKQNQRELIACAVLCGLCLLCVLFVDTFCISQNIRQSVNVSAEENRKIFKWEKQLVENGKTMTAVNLWPDEENPVITEVYRDGISLSDKAAIQITAGSTYHVRGRSDQSILYTELYVGEQENSWYQLLPSAIRDLFDADGWTWDTGWEYTGRAYLDEEHWCVHIKEDDQTAVLYGIGLYLDWKYGCQEDRVFTEEEKEFTQAFGSSDNRFASALEYYYTRSGELESACPKIYVMVSETINGLKNGSPRPVNRLQVEQDYESEQKNHESSEPVLLVELLNYVNAKRAQAGLQPVAWDTADDENIQVRAKEILEHFSDIRPDGTEAFSAYTDAVLSEIRLEQADTPEEIYDRTAEYLLRDSIHSINCAVYKGVTVLIFT